MTKSEIALQLALSVINSGKSIASISTDAKENGKVFAEFYNAIYAYLDVQEG